MANVQWREIPFALVTPAATLPLNSYLATPNPATSTVSVAGPQWLVDNPASQMGTGKRVARDNKPQRPGEIPHKKFRSGMTMQLGLLAVNMIEPTSGVMEPACDEDLVDLMDELMLCLLSIENQDGRLLWTPSGKAPRMLLDARWLGADIGGGGSTGLEVQRENEIFVAAQLALLSPFPYAMDAAEITTCVGSGVTPHCSGAASSVTLVNGGTDAFYPVIKVYGPTSGFEIDRTSALTGQVDAMIYNAALPGAFSVASGHYIEFDFFRETAYLDGNQANAKPGIDVQNSDFWTIDPGAGGNLIEITGATAEILWQDAWGG